MLDALTPSSNALSLLKHWERSTPTKVALISSRQQVPLHLGDQKGGYQVSVAVRIKCVEATPALITNLPEARETLKGAKLVETAWI